MPRLPHALHHVTPVERRGCSPPARGRLKPAAPPDPWVVLPPGDELFPDWIVEDVCAFLGEVFVRPDDAIEAVALPEAAGPAEVAIDVEGRTSLGAADRGGDVH